MNIHYTRLNVGPTCSPGALMAEHCPWPVAERDSRPSRAKLGRQIKNTKEEHELSEDILALALSIFSLVLWV